MNIDYNEINRMAKQMGISPFLLMKRKINYRKRKEKELGCRFCENMRFVGFEINSQRKQCSVIGENYDRYADIDYLYTCNEFKKIERSERFNYKNFIKGEDNESN